MSSGRRSCGQNTHSLLCASVRCSTQLFDCWTHNAYKGFYTSHTNKTPIYEYPAEVRGTAQLIPRSKFLSNGVAILNFRFGHFHLDTGDLGKILGPFAAAFFPEEGNGLIYEDIMFDMCNQRGHRTKIRGIARQLGARCVPRAGTVVGSHLTGIASAQLSRP